jgi:hypothetical protein
VIEVLQEWSFYGRHACGRWWRRSTGMRITSSREPQDSRSLQLDWDCRTPVTPCAGDNSGRGQVLAGKNATLQCRSKRLGCLWVGPTTHCTFRVPGERTHNCAMLRLFRRPPHEAPDRGNHIKWIGSLRRVRTEFLRTTGVRGERSQGCCASPPCPRSIVGWRREPPSRWPEL